MCFSGFVTVFVLIVSIPLPASLIFFILCLLLLSLVYLFCLRLSPSQTLLITLQWTTSPSRSSCWPLGWPRPASEASPRPLLRSGGVTWSRRSLWCSPCSWFVTTDRCTHTLPSPLSLRIQNKTLQNMKNFCKVLIPDVKVQWLVKGSMNNRKCYISLYLSQQELVLFYSKSLDVLSKPIKAHQINPWHCVNKKLALWSTHYGCYNCCALWPHLLCSHTDFCIVTKWQGPPSLVSFVLGL